MEIPCLHLGIMPHKNINAVVDIVVKHFHKYPFWAQMPNYASLEGQFQQFVSGIPGVKTDVLKKKCYLDTKSYLYQTRSKEILKDFEDLSLTKLSKYRPNSVFFDYFLRILDEQKPAFAKGQIVGPLSIGLLLADESGFPVIENRKAMDIIVKSVALQIISQICEMKSICPSLTPYIFVEEPEINKAPLEENAGRSKKRILSILKNLAKVIKDNGAIPVFHSNSCHDWSLPINAGFEVLSFNAETQFVTLLNTNIKMDKFLMSGGKIAWGLLPSDPEQIKQADVCSIFNHYMEFVSRFKNFYKLHKSLILNHSIVTVGMNSEDFTDTISEKSIILGNLLADKISQEAAATEGEE